MMRQTRPGERARRMPMVLGAALVASAIGGGLGTGAPPSDLPPAAAALLAAPASGRTADHELVNAELVNDEVAVAELDPAGLPEQARLISRLTNRGPSREVIDPASLTNVRYLDRVGRPEVTPDGVLLTVGGDSPSALTQARFDKPLPLALHVQYEVDGNVVAPSAVPGMAGEVTITYTLTNTTAQEQELAYEDAAGNPQTSEEPVFAPFQGTLTVTVPGASQVTAAEGAMRSADAQGRTVVRWNVSLFPPLSPPQQRATLTMRTERASIPAIEVVLTPAGADEDPATAFSSDLLAATVSGNAELYDGLHDLDRGAGAVAEGTGRMADGLAGLASGAGQLARAGGQLASGLDQLADGTGQVAEANAELAVALDRAAAGAEALAEATAALSQADTGAATSALALLIPGARAIEAGLASLAGRLGSPADPPLPSPLPPPDDDTSCQLDTDGDGTAQRTYDDDCVTVHQGLRELRRGLEGISTLAAAMADQVESAAIASRTLASDLTTIGTHSAAAARGAAGLLAALCGAAPTLDPGSCQTLADVAAASGTAAATAGGSAPTTKELLTAVGTLEVQVAMLGSAVTASLGATDALLAGIEALASAAGAGSSEQAGLQAGAAALADGLEQLSAGLTASGRALSAALDEVATGSGALSDGIHEAAQGADGLGDGSADLAAGARAAAQGADQVADGIAGVSSGAEDAAGAGRDLATGAGEVAAGTGQAARGVLDASTDPALAAAWLAAAGARADDALPYGAPEGAVGTAAYVFTLEEVAAPRSLWERVRALFGR